MNRRDFITLLGWGAATWPIAAGAQQQPKMLRLGFVGIQPREAPVYTNFLKRMAELGYQEGRNFTFFCGVRRSLRGWRGRFARGRGRRQAGERPRSQDHKGTIDECDLVTL